MHPLSDIDYNLICIKDMSLPEKSFNRTKIRFRNINFLLKTNLKGESNYTILTRTSRNQTGAFSQNSCFLCKNLTAKVLRYDAAVI